MAPGGPFDHAMSSDILDGLEPLYSATATTDYTAFVGREESFSSSDESPPSRSKPTSRAKQKRLRKVQQARDSSFRASNRPLRPAQDILSRLRHDPVLSLQKFTIGYLDRHNPEVMEMPLTSWKGGDVTDEEFIPQHRILWFKRDEDGVKVWDRKARLDSIFDSGLEIETGGSTSLGVGALSSNDSLKDRPKYDGKARNGLSSIELTVEASFKSDAAASAGGSP